MVQSKSTNRGILRSAATQSPPSRFLDYKDFLRTLHNFVEERIGKYSYQQFSADLGFASHNVAYIVVHAYRRLNRDQANTLLQQLEITGAERRYFLKLIDYTDCKQEEHRVQLFQSLVEAKEQLLSSDKDRLMLSFYSAWHHAAIFELIDLPEFQSEPEWIASRFYKRLTNDQVLGSLELLTALGLIKFDDEKRRHVKVLQSLATGDDVRGLAVAGYHMQMMALGQQALSQIPAGEREIDSLTLSLSDEMAKRLKEDIRLFRKYVIFLSEQCNSPNTLMQLNFQLFPITRT